MQNSPQLKDFCLVLVVQIKWHPPVISPRGWVCSRFFHIYRPVDIFLGVTDLFGLELSNTLCYPDQDFRSVSDRWGNLSHNVRESKEEPCIRIWCGWVFSDSSLWSRLLAVRLCFPAASTQNHDSFLRRRVVYRACSGRRGHGNNASRMILLATWSRGRTNTCFFFLGVDSSAKNSFNLILSCYEIPSGFRSTAGCFHDVKVKGQKKKSFRVWAGPISQFKHQT